MTTSFKKTIGILVSVMMLLNPLSIFADTTVTDLDPADPNYNQYPMDIDDTVTVILNDGGSYDVTNPSTFDGIQAENNTEVTSSGEIVTDTKGLMATSGSTIEHSGDITSNDPNVQIGQYTEAEAIHAEGEGTNVTVGIENDPDDITGNVGIVAKEESSVEVFGDVTSTTGNATEAWSGADITIHGDTQAALTGANAHGEGTSILIEGSVQSSQGEGVYAKDGAEVHITEDVTAKTDGVQTIGNATVTVGNNITVTNTDVTNGSKVNGISVNGDASNSPQPNQSVDITVYGDVSASSEGKERARTDAVNILGGNHDYNIPTESANVQNVNIDIKGDISANATSTEASNMTTMTASRGIDVRIPKNNTSDENKQKNNGTSVNITAEKNITVTGDSVSYTDSSGILAYSYDGEINVDVGGNISVDSNASKINQYSMGYGVDARAYQDGQTNVSVGGDINVNITGESDNTEYTYTSSKKQKNEKTDYTGFSQVTVGGDINVTAQSNTVFAATTGISAHATGNTKKRMIQRIPLKITSYKQNNMIIPIQSISTVKVFTLPVLEQR